jgi:hypothetical protein
VRLFGFGRRKRDEQSGPQFGEWLIEQFAAESEPGPMSFHELERICSNAAAIICAAAYQRPEALREGLDIGEEHIEEARLIGRRTGDSFQRLLDDPHNAAVAWPWDHLGTRLAWLAQREMTGDEVGRTGRWLERVGVAYGIGFRQQLDAVYDFWRRLAVSRGEDDQARRDMLELGLKMHDIYRHQREGNRA